MTFDNTSDGDADALLTDADVSALVKVPCGTLRAWRARGLGPRFLRLGARTPRYRRRDVVAWLEERAAAGGAR